MVLSTPARNEQYENTHTHTRTHTHTLAQVLRPSGLHGSSLLIGNYAPVAGITEQRVTLGDVFYSISGEPSTFGEMLDRYHERLLGYSLPYSLKRSLTPEGLRLGTLRVGFSGQGPLDNTRFWFAPLHIYPSFCLSNFERTSGRLDGNKSLGRWSSLCAPWVWLTTGGSCLLAFPGQSWREIVSTIICVLFTLVLHSLCGFCALFFGHIRRELRSNPLWHSIILIGSFHF